MSVAKAMMSAARTAPKGCGVDNLEIAALGLSRLSRLARKMREIGERDSKAFFLRDADNFNKVLTAQPAQNLVNIVFAPILSLEQTA